MIFSTWIESKINIDYIDMMKDLTVQDKLIFKRKFLPPSPLPYKVRTAGFIEQQPYHATLGTYYSDAMITLFVGGLGSYTAKREIIQISAGMIGLVLPGNNVGILTSSVTSPYEHYYCRFSGTEALASSKRIRSKMDNDFARFPQWTLLLDDFRRLITLSYEYPPNTNSENRMTPLDLQLGLILSVIENIDTANTQILSPEKILRYMNERISSPVDLDKMAEYFNVSKEHLCRLSKKFFNKTLYQIWLDMKMDWAKSLLEETDLSVAEISLKCGFNDQFYFSRTFKKYTGNCPRNYRLKK